LQPAGRIRRVSAALLVDDAIDIQQQNGKSVENRRKRTPEELKQIETLAAAAIGLDEKRGDTIAVQNLSFQQPSEQTPEPPSKLERVRVTLNDWSSMIRYAALIVLFLLAYMFLLRPIKKPIESFEPGMSKIPPELLVQLNKKGEAEAPAEALAMVTDVLIKMVGGLHRAGVLIVAGTDVGVPGHTLHRELELYVKAGLTPLEAIQAATITPARVMKLENEVGTIEPGKRADLIILEGDPLENISNIRKVSFVMTQGRLFDCAKLWQIVGFKP